MDPMDCSAGADSPVDAAEPAPQVDLVGTRHISADDHTAETEQGGTEGQPEASLPTPGAELARIQSSTEGKSEKKRRPGRKRKAASAKASAPVKFDPKKPTHRLIKRLLAHHVRRSGTIKSEPMSQKQMQERLKWTRSQVQKAMLALFGEKPFTVYKQKCKDKTIGEFLQDDGIWAR